jgi:transcriptional regulator with XRE-family HTH domain
MRRAELGMKRKDLAKRAGLSYPYVSEIENGNKEPSARALRTLAEALDVSLGALVGLVDRLEGSGSSVLVETDSAPEADALNRQPPVVDALLFAPRATDLAHGSMDSLLYETVRTVVRAELDDWVRTELPAIVRAQLRRLSAEEGDS